MSDAFLILEQPCDEAMTWVIRQVTAAGLQVLRTFDLKVARLAHGLCPCPHHGTDQCDCQMVVLMVYKEDTQPVSLVVHGHDGKTHLTFVDHPAQRADPNIMEIVWRILRSSNAPDGNLGLKPYAA